MSVILNDYSITESDFIVLLLIRSLQNMLVYGRPV